MKVDALGTSLGRFRTLFSKKEVGAHLKHRTHPVAADRLPRWKRDDQITKRQKNAYPPRITSLILP